jgi:TolA-binding protein
MASKPQVQKSKPQVQNPKSKPENQNQKRAEALKEYESEINSMVETVKQLQEDLQKRKEGSTEPNVNLEYIDCLFHGPCTARCLQ